MDRRDFIKLGGTATITAAGVVPATATYEGSTGAPVLEGEANTPAHTTPHTNGVRTLSVGALPFPAALPGQAGTRLTTDIADRFRLKVAALTGGAIRIDRLGFNGSASEDSAAQIGSANGFADPGPGSADIVFATGGYGAHIRPALAIFDGTPWRNDHHPSQIAHWLLVFGGQSQWDQIALDAGRKPLPLAVFGGSRHYFGWNATSGYPASKLGGAVTAAGLNQRFLRAAGLTQNATTDRAWAGLSPLDVAQFGGGLPVAAAGSDGPFLSGPIIAAHVDLARWQELSPTERAILSVAADALRSEILAERAVFAREVYPALIAANPIADQLRRDLQSPAASMSLRASSKHDRLLAEIREQAVVADRDALAVLASMERLMLGGAEQVFVG